MNNSPCWLPSFKYTIFENENYKIWLSGIVVYENDIYNNEKIYDLAHKICTKNIDYNEIYGYFRLSIFDKINNQYLLLGDNSGSQYFYYLNNVCVFSDSFLTIKKQIEKPTIDYSAISELFTLGRIFAEDTIIKEIKKTDSNKYYIVNKTGITSYTKELSPFNKIDKAKNNFAKIMDKLISKLHKNKIGAIITGGTDSRTILSYLNYAGLKPKLVLTGHKDNPDIPIAKEISNKLGLALTIIEPNEINEEKLVKAYKFLDGAYDVVLSYRHYLKSQWILENNLDFEIGGVGGEFYKNVSCHPLINGIKGINSFEYYYKTILLKNKQYSKFFGKELKTALEEDINKLYGIAKIADNEPVFLSKCNKVYFEYLKSAFGSITNAYSSVCCKIDPLMDRNLVAVSSQTTTLKHDLNLWQRRHINKFCKEIADIKTDQGYTCSLQKKYFMLDFVKQMKFNLSRIIARIQRKLGFKYKDITSKYWDKDYLNARKTDIWRKALLFCKSNGIISPETEESDIPMALTGNIILIGMVFDSKDL